METAIKIAQLPWTTIMTLASGYAGYFIAHLGARGHHKSADITFGTLIFGFWGLFAYLAALESAAISSLGASLVAIVATVALGGLWSILGRWVLEWILRALGVSHSDDLPSAWAALGRRVNVTPLQASIKTTDGMIYHCDDLFSFRDEPDGAFILGGNGDVLLHVTHIKYPNADDFEEIRDVRSAEWGTEITYFPREQIARLDLRRKRKTRLSFFRRFGWR